MSLKQRKGLGRRGENTPQRNHNSADKAQTLDGRGSYWCERKKKRSRAATILRYILIVQWFTIRNIMGEGWGIFQRHNFLLTFPLLLGTILATQVPGFLACFGYLPGPSRRLAPVIKCDAFLCFQSYIVTDISLTEIYRWLVTLIDLLSAILKSTRYGGESRGRLQLFGNDTFPNLYDVLVYERKRESEYLERQTYERSLKSEPSIVKQRLIKVIYIE